MTVAELLLRSRTSAQNALKAKKGLDIASVHLLASEALQMRQQAHEADPEHLDPAWLMDARNHRGQFKREKGKTPAEVSQAHHAKMVAHLQREVDGTELTVETAEVEVNRDGGEPDKTKHVGPVKEMVTFLKRVRPAPQIVPLSDDEIEARITLPHDERTGEISIQLEKSMAFQQLMKEQGR